MKHNFAAVIAVLLFLTACSQSNNGNAGSVEADPMANDVDVKTLTFAEVVDSTLDGARVQIDGHLALPKFLMLSNNAARIEFFERAGQRGGRRLKVRFALGDCENCMAELPDKYSAQDLEISDNDGNKIHQNEPVRIVGKVVIERATDNRKQWSTLIEVETVEQLPIVSIDYHASKAVKMTPESLSDSTIGWDVLVEASGELAMPSFVFIDGDLSFDMAIGDTTLRVNFLNGSGPNQIEELPTDFTNKDLKIHDYLSKIVQFSKPIKVWGARDIFGTVQVEHVEQ